MNALGANNATYTITGTGTRVTELGSTGYDTYFTFNQPFALNRQGNVTIYGNATVTTGSGVTFNCNSSRTSYTTILNSGATLKLAGEGNMAVTTLNASNGTLDFSALSSRSAALPYITGTVQLGANTSIIVPEGTTSPYKIGSAVTGTYPGSITIGSKTYATTLSAGDNAGEIAWTINSATIGAAGTYTLEDLFTSTSTTGSYEIDVEESATLNVASASTIANLTFNVADGKTLTITGSDLTISGEIVLNGGTVAASSATALSGTVGGDGRFIYTAIPEGMTWTGSGWTGTLTLQDLTFENKLFSTYGNTGSTLELVGVQGYNNEMVGGSQTWVNPTVKFTDSETAGREFGFKYTGANNGSYFTFNIIAGTGKLVCVDNSTQTMRAGVYTDFSGSIDIGTHAFIFGTSSNTGDSGTITVPSGVTLAVAAGETWTASNGFVVNGTLTIEDGATASGSFSGSGTVVANKMIPPTASTFTGTLTVNAAAYPSSTDSDATAIYGASLNVASGVLKLTGNVATWPTTVNISSGAYLWIANTSMESLALKVATFEGMLYLEEASGLTRLSLDVGGNRNLSSMRLALPSSATLATVNIAFDEAQGEGGTITLSNVSGISAVEGRTYNVTVNCLDGRTVTGTYDSSTGVVSYVPSISGSATDLDWDFTDGENDAFEQAPSGMGKNHDDSDNTPLSFYTDADDSTQTGVYIKHHPYTTGAASWFTENSAAMTVVVVGTMPSTQNTIFLNFGSAYVNKYGLLIATTANENEVLIGYNYGGTVTPITTMTVPNASSSRHSYIVTKVDGETATTFTVYLDGTKWKTVTTDAATLGAASDVKVAFTGDSNNGIQVGSDYGGNIRNAAVYSAASDDAGILNVLRAYGRIITQAEIDAYAAAFPYDSPSGKSTRTFTAASENWIDETENSAVWSNTKSGNTSGTPDVGAQLEVTASAASAQTIAVNLAAQASYESLLVEGTQTVTFQLADGYAGAIAPGKTTIKMPVIVKPGVLNLSGGPTFVEGDGHLTFDYSGYTMSGTSAIELTGQMDRNDDAVTIIPPTDQTYTYTYGYSGTQYVITPAVAVAVLNHNDTLTGYTTIDAAMSAAVSGDTVTLQTAYLTPGTHATYAGDKTGVNVVVQGYTIAPAVADGTTTWSTSSYIWTGAGADNNWTTPANWGLASGYPGSSGGVTTTPADNVIINESATINVNAAVYVYGITMNADVKYTSSNNGQFFLERTYGTGKMSLGGITLNVMRNGRSDRATGKLFIENNVEVCDGTVNTITIYKNSDNNYAQTATISGNLSGSGELRVDVTGTSGTGLYNYNRGLFLLGSDNSGFSGKFAVVGEADASGVVSGSANAEWSFNTYSRDGYAYATRGTGITEYYFGSLSGTLDLNGNASSEVQKYNMTIHVGGKNEDCTFGGRMGRSDKGFPNTFIKEGTADCTYTGTEIGNLQMQNGTFIIGNSNALNSRTSLIFTGGALSVAQGLAIDPVSKFSSSSTAAVVFDDRGYDNEWATALTAANTPYGLTKKGTGTLTLSASTATIGGPTTVSEGVLVVPVGTTFNGAVTVAEGAKIQFEADPTWADGATPTICTFTTAPDADTLSRIEITGFGGRQSAELNYNSGTGAYVATVTSPTLVWNGADGANWGDTGVWLIGETPATFLSGDKVSFPDSLFTGETTELTVNVGADIDPSLVTIAPAVGHTYKFTGTGKVTTADIVVAATGAGTVKLAADVFSGLEIETAGMVTVAAGDGAVTLAKVTSSSDSTALKVTSGSLTLTEGLGCIIQNDATLILDGTFNLNKTITGTSANAELIIRGTIDRTQNGMLQWLNGYPGKFKLEDNATLKYYFRNSGSYYQNRNMFGNGAVEFAGGTIYQVHANSPQDAEPINDVTLVDNTTTTISRQDGTAVLRFKGTFDGNGTLDGDASMALALTDASEFGGAVSWTHSSSSTANNIETATATSADATYNVSGAPAAATQLIGLDFSGTAEMGAFNVSSANAQIGVNNANVELEIGGKANSASTLNGQFITNPLTLTKVGANSTLTLGSGFSAVSGSTIDVQAGTLTTEALTLSGQTLTVGANATATATGDLVLNGGTLNVNGTVNIGNNPVALWLKAKNDAIINLNAGGNLNICRIRADGSYTMNFDGGTLTEYGAGNGNDDVIGGTTWDTSEAHTITLNVKAGGLTVDTATATKIYPVLSGDAESIGGGLTKKGAGTLTLAAAPTFTGAITVEAGSVVLPTGDYTLGANTIVSARGDGTMTLAYATTVALTVPAVDGTTVAVTYVDSNGDTQTVAVSNTANVYLVPVGTEVTVTYTGTTGTVVTSGGTITGIYHEATEVDTTGVTVASAAVWVGNAVENGDNLWSTATNWDPEGVPGQTTLVEFPAANSEYTVILTGWSPCAGMSVEGTVTVQQQSDTVNWLAIQSGAIIGDGTLKLNNIGVSNDTGATVTIAPDLVVLTTGNDGDGNGQKQTTFANGAFTFNGDVTVDGWMFTVGAVNTYNGTVTVNGRFRQVWGGENVHYRPVFNGDVVIGQGVYMDNYSDAGFEFNGGTVTGLGTGGTLHTGNGSNTKITGQGLTVAGNVVIGSGGTQTPVEAPVLMRPGSTLTIRNYVSVTSVNPVDAAYCAVTDNESSPRVFTCSWKAEAKPEIDMTAEAPVTVTTSGVTFAVAKSSLKPGLYYRVKAVDGKGNVSETASTDKVKYTGNNASELNFTAPLPTDGVLYYTIEASDDE